MPGERALAGIPDELFGVASQLARSHSGYTVLRVLESARELLSGWQSGEGESLRRLRNIVDLARSGASGLEQIETDWGACVSSYSYRVLDFQNRARKVIREWEDARGRLARLSEQQRQREEQCFAEGTLVLTQRVLDTEIDRAEESVAEKRRHLERLDEERAWADGEVTSRLDDISSRLRTLGAGLPLVPPVSGSALVTAVMPDGGTVTCTALGLARFADPGRIRTVWDALSAEDQELLIRASPLTIGNLDGIPLRDRHTANVITACAHREDLEAQLLLFEKGLDRSVVGERAEELNRLRDEIRSIDAVLGDRNERYVGEVLESGDRFGEYSVRDENGRPVTQRGLVLVGFNPLRDSFITYQGALDPRTGDVAAWTPNVGVFVPGTNSGLASLSTQVEQGRSLVNLTYAYSGVFVWRGAPMPQADPMKLDVVEPAQRGFGEVASVRLVGFTNHLRLPEATECVPIGYSYGGAVLGLAEKAGLKADRIVYLAPAGLGHGAEGLPDFPSTGDKPHFLIQARNDGVIGVIQGVEGLGVGHGTHNPTREPGVIRLETGYLDVARPELGTVESVGGGEAHTAVLRPGSTAMKNIAGVLQGSPVSLYHPDDELPYIAGGGAESPRMRIRPGTGVRKPEEFVSGADGTRIP